MEQTLEVKGPAEGGEDPAYKGRSGVASLALQ